MRYSKLHLPLKTSLITFTCEIYHALITNRHYHRQMQIYLIQIQIMNRAQIQIWAHSQHILFCVSQIEPCFSQIEPCFSQIEFGLNQLKTGFVSPPSGNCIFIWTGVNLIISFFFLIP
jgi:hypothetical protein